MKITSDESKAKRTRLIFGVVKVKFRLKLSLDRLAHFLMKVGYFLSSSIVYIEGGHRNR